MTIDKTRLNYGRGEYYSFVINLEEGKFEIIFAGNLDLYWNYSCKYEELLSLDEKVFRVTEKDKILYELIKELHENIKNYNIYAGNEFDFSPDYNEDFKRRLMEIDKSNPQKLCSYGIVDWHSDDYVYEEASRLLIEKEKDDYVITFVKGIMEFGRPTFAIRFRNSGSRYDPFNVCFMHMYNKLVDFIPTIDKEEEFHQISIQEYMDELRLVRTKK